MKLGIISDTHDNVENIKAAVEIFKIKGVDRVIHCGDIVAPITVTFFNGLDIWFIKGNNDGDIKGITQKAEEIGGAYCGEDLDAELAGKKVGACHGDNTAKFEGMINSKKYDYVLTGHTHEIRDEKIGSTRVINPGGHYYGNEGTVAVLDLNTDSVEFISVREESASGSTEDDRRQG